MYEICKVVRPKILYRDGFVTKEGEGNPFLFVIFATSYIFLACLQFLLFILKSLY